MSVQNKTTESAHTTMKMSQKASIFKTMGGTKDQSGFFGSHCTKDRG